MLEYKYKYKHKYQGLLLYVVAEVWASRKDGI